MKSWKFIITSFLFFYIGQVSRLAAQPYPVTVTINVIPPSGVSLAEYQVSQAPKVMASIILTDLEKPTFKVRLKLTIAGNGILLTTSRNAILPPVDLIAGQAVVLDQASLAGYFDIGTMDISGVNRSLFIQRGQTLPEGTYNICLEAFDYNRPDGLPVSNTGCTIAQLELYDPPILNPPDFSNTILFDMQPPLFQQGFFTWQPMHTGVFPVDYNLRIYRQQGEGMKLPDNITMEYAPPYISIRTTNLFYHLSPTDPPLMPDEKYYAIVQVVPVQYPALFKNNGNSQRVVFTINTLDGVVCERPQEYRGVGVRPGIALDWKSFKACDAYVTEYYDLADEVRLYQDAEIKTGSLLTDTIRSVVSEHVYILRTGCVCIGDTLYTDTIRVHFKRPKATVPPFACGVENGGIAGIQSYLPALHANDTIVAADIQVIIRQASGSNGHFSGKGHIVVPYLKYARVNVTFTDITVNDEYRMTDGELKVIGVGQNIIGDNTLAGILTLLEGLDDLSDLLGEAAEILSMLDALLLEMAENMPPWLIQEILDIKGIIANPPEGADLAALQEKLKKLESERKDWERLYWEIIMEALVNLDEYYSQNGESIKNAYFNQVVNFPKISQTQKDDPVNNNPEPRTLKKAGIRTKTVSQTEFKADYPQLGNNFNQLYTAREEYLSMRVLGKIEDELNIENIQDFIKHVKMIGYDMIKLIGVEFKARDFDMDKISEDPDLKLIVMDIAKQSIYKIIYQL